MEQYLPILIFVLIAILFLAATLIVASLMRHAGGGKTNREPYECGNEPQSFAHDHPFSIRYYLIAVLFVVFDVEVALVVPVAVIFRQLVESGNGVLAFIEMFFFLTILFVALVYVWARGDLRWVRALTAGECREVEIGRKE